MDTDTKARIVKEFGRDENDTGSSEVQIALLTARIKELTAHMQQHPNDVHTRRGLIALVNRRRKLMRYLRRQDVKTFNDICERLSLRH